MFYENWKDILGKMFEAVHSLSFVSRIAIYLLFKKCHVTTDLGEISYV